VSLFNISFTPKIRVQIKRDVIREDEKEIATAINNIQMLKLTSNPTTKMRSRLASATLSPDRSGSGHIVPVSRRPSATDIPGDSNIYISPTAMLQSPISGTELTSSQPPAERSQTKPRLSVKIVETINAIQVNGVVSKMLISGSISLHMPETTRILNLTSFEHVCWCV
jgi:hypothetical protein